MLWNLPKVQKSKYSTKKAECFKQHQIKFGESLWSILKDYVKDLCYCKDWVWNKTSSDDKGGADFNHFVLHILHLTC